ncbi:MAG: hypothetical protein ACLFWM_04695 [Actinomycetota bacterium]
MLMPTLSVTLIGLTIGAVAGLTRGLPGRGILVGTVAAWAGFVVGAFVGVLLDALLGTGVWLAWLGHGGALVAASFSFAIRPTPETAVT